MADDSINVLKLMRKNIEKEIKIIFERVEEFCKKSNTDISLLRRVSKHVGKTR